MKLLFLFLAAWAPRVTHPVKDAATHEMLRAVSQEHDRAVREEARDALDFIAGSLDTNLVIALPAVDTTGWSDADVERHLQAPEVLLQEAAVRAAGERGLTNAVPVLTVLLRDSDERLRGAVCESLAQLRRGAPVVAKLLEVEPSVRVRAKAVTALLAVHDQQARRLLLELLGHTRWQTREAAVQGLQGWGDRELALTLATLLTDPNEAVQRAAATALRELRHPGTERALLDRLPAASLAVQIPIIEALGELHSVAAVPSLVDWVKGTNDALGKVSAEALAKIDDDRVIPAMRHVIYNVTYLQMTTRPVALRVLRERKDDALADRMVQFVTDQIVPPPPMAPGPMYDSVEARMEALRYLQKFGTAKQGARILERLTETVPAEMRPLLAEVLTKLTGRTYRPLPDQDYRRYFVESLAPNPFPLVAVPGVVLEELPREPRGQQE